MQINSISAQTNSFNGVWQKISLRTRHNPNKALGVINEIRYMAHSIPGTVYIKATDDNSLIDITKLGNLGCFGIMADKEFLFRVTSRKASKIISEAIKKCCKARNYESARKIADTALDKYNFTTLRSVMPRSNIDSLMRSLRAFFKPGENFDPGKMLDAIEKCCQARTVKAAKKAAACVTGPKRSFENFNGLQ